MRTDPTAEFKFFIRLARKGKHPGASSGEKHAHRLAMAVLDSIDILDDRAVEGLIDFIHYSKGAPETVRSLVEE
jgi:hypothetical protein